MRGKGRIQVLLDPRKDQIQGNWSFGSVSSLQYTYFGMTRFSENGAQSLDLQNLGWNGSSLIYNLGANCAYSWQANRDLMVETDSLIPAQSGIDSPGTGTITSVSGRTARSSRWNQPTAGASPWTSRIFFGFTRRA